MDIQQYSIDPVFGWFAMIFVAVLLIASLWLSFASQGISLGGRMVLFLLRLVAMLVLLIGWLRPGLVSEVTKETPGAVAVLMDYSQSMTLPSESADLSRWQMQQRVWERLQSETDLQIGETRLIPYFYAEKPVAADSEDLPGLTNTFEQEPEGRITDLGQTLSELASLQVEPPLRGVIVMGDLTQTATPATIDPSLIARQMAQLDQPIFVVGLGHRGDQSKIRDVGIEGLQENFTAFVKKELTVRLIINAKGMKNQPIRLETRLRASGKQDIVVDSREILAVNSSQLIPQELTIEVPEVGDYMLESVVQVDAEDQIPSNNQAISFISVRDGGAKILCIDGSPRFEQSFLRRALNDSLDFDVDYLLLWESDRKARKGRPSTIEQDVKLTDYDAFLIGDVAASEFSREAQSILARHVEAGAGIIFNGGYHSFDAGGYGRSGLRSLFPIELGQGSVQAFDKKIDPRFHIQGDVQLRLRDPHPITAILPEPENSAMWSSLPPLSGINRIRRSIGPGVQSLLQTTDGNDVLVKGQYGQGRVLAFAGDSTWRWWMAGESKICKQFWRQAVLWLISRETLSEGFKLNMETRRLLVDQNPEVQIEWFGGSDNNPMPTEVAVELSRDGTSISTQQPVLDGENQMKVKLSGLREPGLYRAKLQSTGTDGLGYESEIAFIVKDESRELSRPDPDWQMMKNIVSANQAAGGKQILPDEIDQAIDLLRERQESAKVTSIEKRRLGDSAIDSWIYLVIFCLLMSMEWGLRKSWQLP
ncbi:MAG: glutamine amidotransferase [Planctomycetota bacterium]